MEEIRERLVSIEKDIESHSQRLDKLEDKQESILELVITVKELAMNMKSMTEVQKTQNERLEKLEQEPLNNAKFYRREIIKTVLTVIVGAIVGALIALIIK